MGQALASGNKIWYDNAKRHYGEAKARETLGEGEAAGDKKETLGYSAEFYQAEIENHMKKGNESSVEHAIEENTKAIRQTVRTNAAMLAGGIAGVIVGTKINKK